MSNHSWLVEVRYLTESCWDSMFRSSNLKDILDYFGKSYSCVYTDSTYRYYLRPAEVFTSMNPNAIIIRVSRLY